MREIPRSFSRSCDSSKEENTMQKLYWYVHSYNLTHWDIEKRVKTSVLRILFHSDSTVQVYIGVLIFISIMLHGCYLQLHVVVWTTFFNFLISWGTKCTILSRDKNFNQILMLFSCSQSRFQLCTSLTFHNLVFAEEPTFLQFQLSSAFFLNEVVSNVVLYFPKI